MKSLFITAMSLLAVGTMFCSSCDKVDDVKESVKPPEEVYECASCVANPEAMTAYDNSSKGVYKGIVIGSSGTIKFSVQNGGSDIVATLVIDGTTVSLNSSVNWVDGQPYVAPFTGTLNGQAVSVTFSVQHDGSSPQVLSSSIPGHSNAVFSLVKETSNALMECFEGTYSTTEPESGTFNIILSRTLGKWGGIARESGSEEKKINGSLEGDVMKDEDGRTMGDVTGDLMGGTFEDGGGSTITFEGKRTL